jgi:hypothetical protein
MNNVTKMEQPRIIGKDEKWFRWEPITELKQACDIISIKDDREGLEIIVGGRKTDQKMTVIFDPAWAYRTTYETYRMFLISDLFELYGDKFCVERSFFRVENSSYMKWLSIESAGLTDKLIHFVIMDNDFVMDIAAYEEPKIRIINK